MPFLSLSLLSFLYVQLALYIYEPRSTRKTVTNGFVCPSNMRLHKQQRLHRRGRRSPSAHVNAIIAANTCNRQRKDAIAASKEGPLRKRATHMPNAHSTHERSSVKRPHPRVKRRKPSLVDTCSVLSCFLFLSLGHLCK